MPAPGCGPAIASGGRGSAGGSSRARSVLVVANLALALVLLAGAGVMLRTVAALARVNCGIDPTGVMTLQFSLVGKAYAEDTAVLAFQERLLDRLRVLPGVTGAALAGLIPFADNFDCRGFHAAGRMKANTAEDPCIQRYGVTPDYAGVMGVPVRRGRFFDATDTATSPPVIVILQATAAAVWGEDDPIGAQVRLGNAARGPWRTVIGIVGDGHHAELTAPVTAAVYTPQSQQTNWSLIAVIKSAGADPAALAAPVRAAIREQDPAVPIYDVATLASLVDAASAQHVFVMRLLAGFALIAVLLAATGLYGVLAYGISQRTREVGVRVALGAQPGHVMRLVLGEGTLLTAAGLGLGLVGAFAATRQLLGAPPLRCQRGGSGDLCRRRSAADGRGPGGPHDDSDPAGTERQPDRRSAAGVGAVQERPRDSHRERNQIMRVLLSRIAGLLRGRRLDARLDDEVRFHIDMLAQDYVRRGMPGSGSTRRRTPQLRRSHPDEGKLPRSARSAVHRDVAAGCALQRPVVSADARLHGRGAHHACARNRREQCHLFSVVNAVLLEPLPYSEPDRIVQMYRSNAGLWAGQNAKRFQFFKEQMQSFEAFAAWRRTAFNLASGNNTKYEFEGIAVSHDYFKVFGGQAAVQAVPPILKRTCRMVRTSPSSVIRRGAGCLRPIPRLWAIAITLGDRTFTIVGVMPEGFDSMRLSEIYVPLQAGPDRSRRWIQLRRCRPGFGEGVSISQANAEAESVFSAYRAINPTANFGTETATRFLSYQEGPGTAGEAGIADDAHYGGDAAAHRVCQHRQPAARPGLRART